MKTKTKTKQIKQARQNKQAAKLGKKEVLMQYVAAGLFFAAVGVIVVNLFNL